MTLHQRKNQVTKTMVTNLPQTMVLLTGKTGTLLRTTFSTLTTITTKTPLHRVKTLSNNETTNMNVQSLVHLNYSLTAQDPEAVPYTEREVVQDQGAEDPDLGAIPGEEAEDPALEDAEGADHPREDVEEPDLGHLTDVTADAPAREADDAVDARDPDHQSRNLTRSG